jgi:hypothetical protein
MLPPVLSLGPEPPTPVLLAPPAPAESAPASDGAALSVLPPQAAPIDDNSTPAGRKNNRRVEFHIEPAK